MESINFLSSYFGATVVITCNGFYSYVSSFYAILILKTKADFLFFFPNRF